MTRIYSCSNSSRTLKLQRAFGRERGVFLAIGGPGDDEALGAVLTPEQALDLARQLDAIAGQPKPEPVAVGDDFTQQGAVA